MKTISTFLFCLLVCSLFSQSSAYICHHEGIGVFPLDDLNTKFLEFSPVYYENGLVYVVAREKSRVFDPKTGQAYFDLMYADLGPAGITGKSVNFSPNIRTQYHEGPCTFSSDASEMFFTRSNLSGGQGITDEQGKVQLKIYRAFRGLEDWEDITELPFCSDQYAVAHPALSDDGFYLVFSSDMPGGHGGMDLYIVNRTTGKWSEPVNLGAGINTKGHEVFPNWHPSGYLFFSSDGHKGKGGLDLFVTAWSDGELFTGLQHLEAPFNSSKDDLGMIVSSDGTSGFLASDRKPTKGKDDLYRWMSPQSIFCFPAVEPADKMLAKEIIVTDESNVPVPMTYAWLIPMDKEGPLLHKEHFNMELMPDENKEGAFLLRWGVTDTLSAETADAVSDLNGHFQLNAIEKQMYILVARHPSYQPFVTVVAAEYVPSFIRLKKIPEDSAPCLNTMFTVYDANGELRLNGAKIQLTGPCLKNLLTLYTDELGSAKSCFSKGCSLKAEFMQEGYAPHAFTFTPSEEGEHWKIYLKSGEGLTAPPAPIVSGTVIVLDNIYYDFNKSEIRKGDAEELIALAKILKQYPDLTIELTSHTDTRGTAEYNMELSKRRSESSKSYLVLLGIQPSRITTRSAGETSPRNQCLDDVPCSEEEHQYNRRTEVRIINPAQGMEIRYKAEG